MTIKSNYNGGITVKRIVRCLFVFLILFSLVGCEKTNHLHEINENSASTTVVMIDPQTISTTLVFNVEEISIGESVSG